MRRCCSIDDMDGDAGAVRWKRYRVETGTRVPVFCCRLSEEAVAQVDVGDEQAGLSCGA